MRSIITIAKSMQKYQSKMTLMVASNRLAFLCINVPESKLSWDG